MLFIMKRSEKIFLVSDLAAKIKDAKSVAVIDYTNLKANQMNHVRDALRDLPETELEVTKNSFFIKAIRQAGFIWSSENSEKITGQNAFLISSGDEVAALSIIAKLAKELGGLKFKLGLLGNRVLSDSELVTLASLPPMKVMQANVVNILSRPLSGLVYGLNWNLGKLVRVLFAVGDAKSVTAA